MERWQQVWRTLATLLSREALESLRKGLECNDCRLIQGCTLEPPGLIAAQDWPVEAACAVAYARWKGDELTTVGEVHEAFADVVTACDERLPEDLGVDVFLNTYDEWSREEMRRLLLPEVELALEMKEKS